VSRDAGAPEPPRSRVRAFLSGKGDSRLEKTVTGIAVGLLITVIAAWLGLTQSGNAPPAHTGASARPPANSNPGSSSSTAATTASSQATPSSRDTASPAIYHEGTLTVAFNTCVDLDASSSDPQWGVSTNYHGAVDLCSQSPDVGAVNGATLVTVKDGADTTCHNATGWLPSDYLTDLHLGVGAFLCVHTNEDRYSLLRVETVDSAAEALTFEVKTFE
jgi:hypothetical protein